MNLADALPYIGSVLTALVFMSLVFVVARRRNRYDVIDIAWGLVFIAIAAVGYVGQPNIEIVSIQTLVLILVAIWGLRLSRHIAARWSRSAQEDARYVSMRKDYSKKQGGLEVNMYFRVFIVQGLLAVVVSLSIIMINASDVTAIQTLAVVGGLVWLAGFLFESVGDKQLRQHLADPKNKGKLMTSGLWSYTRHPNYFGEVVQWWGIFIIALSVPYGWISIIAPLTITSLILFVSGVPLTERAFDGRPGWAAYKKRTSIFLPLLPRK